jgi:hypothetical protein
LHFHAPGVLFLLDRAGDLLFRAIYYMAKLLKVLFGTAVFPSIFSDAIFVSATAESGIGAAGTAGTAGGAAGTGDAAGAGGGGGGSEGDNLGSVQCRTTRMNTATVNEYMRANFQSILVPITPSPRNINPGFVAMIAMSKKHVTVASVYIFDV